MEVPDQHEQRNEGEEGVHEPDRAEGQAGNVQPVK
jgi:hypothetical protein